MKTVRAKITVAVGFDGAWVAAGGSDLHTKLDREDMAAEQWDDGRLEGAIVAYHTVEVDIPMPERPESQTITATPTREGA